MYLAIDTILKPVFKILEPSQLQLSVQYCADSVIISPKINVDFQTEPDNFMGSLINQVQVAFGMRWEGRYKAAKLQLANAMDHFSVASHTWVGGQLARETKGIHDQTSYAWLHTLLKEWKPKIDQSKLITVVLNLILGGGLAGRAILHTMGLYNS